MIQPQVIWFTGLSGAGKTTLALALQEALLKLQHKTFLIDGDILRKNMGHDLGFSKEDRSTNVRRATRLANEKIKEGYIVIVSLISPSLEDRALAKSVIGLSQFKEVYVNTPLSVCEARDPKGLYQKARLGLISNMTGINSLYEPPLKPDLLIDTSKDELKTSIDQIMHFIYLN